MKKKILISLGTTVLFTLMTLNLSLLKKDNKFDSLLSSIGVIVKADAECIGNPYGWSIIYNPLWSSNYTCYRVGPNMTCCW